MGCRGAVPEGAAPSLRREGRVCRLTLPLSALNALEPSEWAGSEIRRQCDALTVPGGVMLILLGRADFALSLSCMSEGGCDQPVRQHEHAGGQMQTSHSHAACKSKVTVRKRKVAAPPRGCLSPVVTSSYLQTIKVVHALPRVGAARGGTWSREIRENMCYAFKMFYMFFPFSPLFPPWLGLCIYVVQNLSQAP